MASKISPISGFPEYLPAQQRAFDAIVAKVRAAYESFGYTALETAVVERTDTLLAKGIDAKEVYGLRRLAAGEGEDGAKELALRFDLTVPTARYVAQNYGQLVFPFRRHQIQPVWRGERPQAGRYRQFHQCDIDYIADGAGSLPLAADAEILACAYTALKSLGLKFTMRVSTRKYLEALFNATGIVSLDKQKLAVKIIDNIEKVDLKITRGLLIDLMNGDVHHATNLLNMLFPTTDGGIFQLLKSPELDKTFSELQEVIGLAKGFVGYDENDECGLVFDPKIARGLDYYTGTVVETTLHAAPELGSICSGGRYENLAENLSERALPGVGISIGISRLATWLMTQEPWNAMAATCADVYVAYGLGDVANRLRALGLKVEEGLDDKQSIGKQMQIAQKRGFNFAVKSLDDEFVWLRELATQEDTLMRVEEVKNQIRLQK